MLKNKITRTLVLMLTMLPILSYAQDDLNVGNEGPGEPQARVRRDKKLPIYAPDPEIVQIWEELMSSPDVNWPESVKIQIKSTNNNNFLAVKANGENIIYYDSAYCLQFGKQKLHDLVFFSFLHELGHFANHDVDVDNPSAEVNKKMESEADQFALNIVCAMHMSKRKVTDVMKLIGNPVISKKYPSKGERLQSIEDFYTANICKIPEETK